MKIERISFFTPVNNVINSKKENKSNNDSLNNMTYNPHSYRDFNISFSQRLFRTPENFYAQPFNKNGMPDTMKDYLNADFSDRQKMPPAQMLKVVFDDIKETKSLEQVRRLFPEEPLFKNLTDTPNRKSRTGVLAEIEIMHQDDKSLFKNGQNNLGLYLLKKIYTEAKTLKEINTDFQKDISVHYKGLSPIDYSTLAAFGIKYPNNSFWKSLTATREEFPYEYKPRNPIVSRSTQPKSSASEPSVPATKSEKRRFGNVKAWEIDKLSDALIKGNGSKDETEKQLKKRNVQNKDAQNFVAKYMGEINAVVLEKLHISPDMKDFFSHYDDPDKTQTQKFEEYMKNPYINNLRSKVMSSTIRFFFDVYGVDGNNDEFRELLDYAHSIKSNRIAKQLEHDKLQEEYERELGIFEPVEDSAEALNPNDVEKVPFNPDEILDDITKMYNAECYTFNTELGDVKILANLKEAFNEKLNADFAIMPKSFANKFIKTLVSDDTLPESYILTSILENRGFDLPKDDRLMSEDDALNKTLEIYQIYSDKNQLECRAAQQAVVDAFINYTTSLDGPVTPRIFSLGAFEFIPFSKAISPDLKSAILAQHNFINSNFSKYKQPLSDSEVRKATITFIDLLRRYNPKNSIISEDGKFSGFNYLFACFKDLVNLNVKDINVMFKDEITSYLKDYGGSARFLLDKNISEEYKMAKLENILTNFMFDRNTSAMTYILSTTENIDTLRRHCPVIYKELCQAGLINS